MRAELPVSELAYSRDPFGRWTVRRRWLWASLTVFVCIWQGPGFVTSLRPPRTAVLDFFGEWASARNLVNDLPIYEHLDGTVERYLGWKRDPGARWYWQLNSHPPSSVLLAVPLAWLDYPDAFLAWNLLSLAALAASIWIVVRQLRIAFSPWSLLPVVTLLLVCNPLRHQVFQGQLNLVLLLLLTGTWAAARSGRSACAGVLLAAATTIKIFPGFLFVYFLLRRRWEAVAAGTVGLISITVVTAAIVGPQAYRSYLVDVIPHIGQFHGEWLNASLAGFWCKLFDAGAEILVLKGAWRGTALARLGTLLSCAVVVAVLVPVIWRARTQSDRDRAFGSAVVAMLLLSPTTWDHYFLLLLVPLAVMWIDLPPRGLVRWAFIAGIALLWIHPTWLWNGAVDARDWNKATTLALLMTQYSLHCYALLTLFFLGSGKPTLPGVPRNSDLVQPAESPASRDSLAVEMVS